MSFYSSDLFLNLVLDSCHIILPSESVAPSFQSLHALACCLLIMFWLLWFLPTLSDFCFLSLDLDYDLE